MDTSNHIRFEHEKQAYWSMRNDLSKNILASGWQVSRGKSWPSVIKK